MDEIKKLFKEVNRFSPEVLAFGWRLNGLFQTCEIYRRPKELEWLESLRQYKGLYDPGVVIDANASKVYPKITRSKVNIVLSRLHQMLFPETERNWEYSPTKEPRMDKAIVKNIAMSLVQQGKDGSITLPTADVLADAIRGYAKMTCDKMMSVADDQLTEMDYPELTKKVLRSGLMYGTGVMKGPMISKRQKRRWYPDGEGEYVEKVDEEDVPFLEFVPIWDWYPDMSVVDVDKMVGSFQRHIMTKHDLRVLSKRDDFYNDVIFKYLTDHPHGDYTPKNWEVDLQIIETEAGSGTPAPSRSTSTQSSAFNDSESSSTNRPGGTKYQVLEFWGYVDGSDLEKVGIETEDPELEYGANIWLIGSQVIKAVLFDSAIDQFKVFYYEKDETSIFGEGLARVMRHSQIAIAGAARMVLDNGACVSGPNVEVNYSLMVEGTDFTSFYPRKIWFREGRGVEAQYPAIRDIQFDSHIPDLLSIIETFKSFGDEETCLPTWMIGQMVNNETAQASSGRQAMITVSIKDIVKNFDTFTERVLRAVYAWNMEFNPRPDIKGDYNVKARGVESLVMKEIRMQALTQMKNTLTPEDWVYIPRREFLQEFFKSHDINLKLRTETEAQKIIASMQDEKAQELAYRMQEAEIAYKKSQTMAQLTKAKDKNVEANIKARTPIEEPTGEHPSIIQGEAAKLETERKAKEEEIRRKDEMHQIEMGGKMQDMKHKQEAHETKLLTETTKTAADIHTNAAKSGQDMKLKEETTKHGMKMKETLTKSSAKAKEIAAKRKPAPSKPSKSAK
jgi:hypothetical protein